MSWFWVNIPLCAMFFAAVVGVPLWMVIRHPDTDAGRAGSPRQAAGAEALVPVAFAPAKDRPVPAERATPVADTAQARELVGTSAGCGD